MSLSKATAAAIVDAVSQDVESRRRLHSILRFLGPVGTQHRGGLRDTGLEWKAIFASLPALGHGWGSFTGRIDNKLNDPAYADLCCVGIADATVAAINKAGITEVAAAAREDRILPEWHSVTGVTMRDGSQYTFDWFLTLAVNNPVIFRLDEWRADMSFGIQFAGFSGLEATPPTAEVQRRQLKEVRSTY